MPQTSPTSRKNSTQSASGLEIAVLLFSGLHLIFSRPSYFPVRLFFFPELGQCGVGPRFTLMSPSWTDCGKEGGTYCVLGSVLLIFNTLDNSEQFYRGGNGGIGKVTLVHGHPAGHGGLWIENQVYVTLNPTHFPFG